MLSLFNHLSLMLPRPLTNLNFSSKELAEFSERISEFAAASKSTESDSEKDSSNRFCTILGTPTKNSASNVSNSPRTPLQRKK
jgi:hypothetical protein